MSVLFDAGTEVVNHGSDPTLDDLLAASGTLTFGGWYRREENGANLWLADKGFTGSAGWLALADFITSQGQGRFAAGGTTTLDYVTNESIFPLNIWAFVVFACRGFTSGVDIFYGTETAPMVEATYETSDNGTGTYGSDATANLRIGGDGATNDAGGRIARPFLVAGAWNQAQAEAARRLSAAGIALLPSIQMASEYSSTSDVADLTANNNDGSVTGATTAANGDFPGPTTRRIQERAA
jgi:hypothetical protein